MKIKLKKGEEVCVHLKDKTIKFGRFKTQKETEDFYQKYVKPFQK